MGDSEKEHQDRTNIYGNVDTGGGPFVGRDYIVHASEPFRTPYQLPPRPDHFTGRGDLLDTLDSLLRPGNHVTLHGPGGIGKSALAYEALHRLQDAGVLAGRFPDGVIFHSFYTHPAAAQALDHITRSFGADPAGDPAAAARRVLAGRRALLLLDGAEDADRLDHVRDVAGACAVLITTRDRKQAGAHYIELGPLDPVEAIRLLKDWAGPYVAPEEAVAKIVQLVGYLPLAVRLAGRYLAAQKDTASSYLDWLQTTPLDALDQGDRRQESVPLLLERSLDQVTPTARHIIAIAGRLALAPIPSAALAAALDYETVHELRRPLGDLVAHGLLTHHERDTFEVAHALIHTYARHRLDVGDETLVLLCRYYALEYYETWRQGPGLYPNLEAARSHVFALIPYLQAAALWNTLLDLAWAIDGFLDVRGYTTDRLALNRAAASAGRHLHNPVAEFSSLTRLGVAYAQLGRVEDAVDHHLQALAIARETGERVSEETRHAHLGVSYAELGRLEEAVDHLLQALAIARERGDRGSEGIHLGNLGFAYAQLGRLEEAVEHDLLALATARERGDRRAEGFQLGNLGFAYAQLGRVEDAVDHHLQALAIARESGDRRAEAGHLGNLGLAYTDLGRLQEAVDHYQQALTIARETGDRRVEARHLYDLGIAYQKLERTQEAIAAMEEAYAIHLDIGASAAADAAAKLVEYRSESSAE